MDRAPAFEAGGWEFESLCGCHLPVAKWIRHLATNQEIASSSLAGQAGGTLFTRTGSGGVALFSPCSSADRALASEARGRWFDPSQGGSAFVDQRLELAA